MGEVGDELAQLVGQSQEASQGRGVRGLWEVAHGGQTLGVGPYAFGGHYEACKWDFRTAQELLLAQRDAVLSASEECRSQSFSERRLRGGLDEDVVHELAHAGKTGDRIVAAHAPFVG